MDVSVGVQRKLCPVGQNGIRNEKCDTSRIAAIKINFQIQVEDLSGDYLPVRIRVANDWRLLKHILMPVRKRDIVWNPRQIFSRGQQI
jgi:hypothetical protein